MQIYHETMFDGPWYESQGPSASEIRAELKIKYKKGWYADNDYIKKIYKENIYNSHNIINTIIDDKILDSMSFGSYRGYATFGICEAIIRNLNNYINQEIKVHAIKIIDKKLTPLIMHKLYKPGGKRTFALKKHFEKITAS